MSKFLSNLSLSQFAVAGLIMTTLISCPIWIGNPFIPRFPVHEILEIPDALSTTLMLVLISLATWIFISDKFWPKCALLTLMLLIFMLDWNKVQPYNLVFGAFILIDSFKKQNDNFSILLMLSGIYFYSGVQKMNVFYRSELDNLLYEFPIEAFKPFMTQLLLYVPFIEIGLALALLFALDRHKKWALLLAIYLHLGIIAFLLSINYNMVVIPWNLTMIACLFLLKSQLTTKKITVKVIHVMLIGFFWILPVYNLFKPQLAYCSWNIYSNRIPYAELYFDNRDLQKLPNELQDNVTAEEHYAKIDLIKYSIKHTNVAINPEPWMYKRMLKKMCKQDFDYETYLFIHLYTFRKKTTEVYACEP